MFIAFRLKTRVSPQCQLHLGSLLSLMKAIGQFKGMVLLAAVAFDVISKQRLLSPAFDKVKRLMGITAGARGKEGM